MLVVVVVVPGREWECGTKARFVHYWCSDNEYWEYHQEMVTNRGLELCDEIGSGWADLLRAFFVDSLEQNSA